MPELPDITVYGAAIGARTRGERLERVRLAVHGRCRDPCLVCDPPIQRVVFARNETNCGANCQPGGRLLADRALSRLLKQDWPRSLEELEARVAPGRTAPASDD